MTHPNFPIGITVQNQCHQKKAIPPKLSIPSNTNKYVPLFDREKQTSYPDPVNTESVLLDLFMKPPSSSPPAWDSSHIFCN